MRVGFKATAGVSLKVDTLEGFVPPRNGRHGGKGPRSAKARSRDMGMHGGPDVASSSPLRKSLAKGDYLGPSISLRIEGYSAASIKPANPSKDHNAAQRVSSFQERQKAAARAAHLRGARPLLGSAKTYFYDLEAFMECPA